MGQRGGIELLRRDEDAERDREIEGGAILANVGGREIHRDPARRHREAGVHERRAHAFAALFHRAGRQAHDRELREPGGRVDLHRHVVRIDPDDGGGPDGGEHARNVPDDRAARVTGATRAASPHCASSYGVETGVAATTSSCVLGSIAANPTAVTVPLASKRSP